MKEFLSEINQHRSARTID